MEPLFDYRQRFAGFETRVLELEGEGPPLLLLHSGFSTWREWRRVLAMLSSARDVLAPTLPGSHGGPPLPLGRGSLLNLFAGPGQVLGIPVLYVYVFTVWALLIGLMAWVVEKRND